MIHRLLHSSVTDMHSGRFCQSWYDENCGTGRTTGMYERGAITAVIILFFLPHVILVIVELALNGGYVMVDLR